MHSDYLSGTFNVTLRRFTVSVLVRYLQPRLHNGDFTHIYVRGLSGVTIGSMVAYELDAPMVALRKADSHGDSPIEGLTESAKCCIIDDLVCTGDTLVEMRNALYAPEQLVGICLYMARDVFPYVTTASWIKSMVWKNFHCKAAYAEASVYGMHSPTELARIYMESPEYALSR